MIDEPISWADVQALADRAVRDALIAHDAHMLEACARQAATEAERAGEKSPDDDCWAALQNARFALRMCGRQFAAAAKSLRAQVEASDARR